MNRNLFNLKQTAGIVLAFPPLHVSLVCQKRQRLHEEHFEYRQPRICDLVLRVLAPAILRYPRQALFHHAQHTAKLQPAPPYLVAYVSCPPILPPFGHIESCCSQ